MFLLFLLILAIVAAVVIAKRSFSVIGSAIWILIMLIVYLIKTRNQR